MGNCRFILLFLVLLLRHSVAQSYFFEDWQDVFVHKLNANRAVDDLVHATSERMKELGVLYPEEKELAEIARFVGSDVVFSVNAQNGLLEGMLESRYKTAVVTTTFIDCPKAIYGHLFSELEYRSRQILEDSGMSVLLIHFFEPKNFNVFNGFKDEKRSYRQVKVSKRKFNTAAIVKQFSGSKVIFVGKDAPLFFVAKEEGQRFHRVQKMDNISFYCRGDAEFPSLKLQARSSLSQRSEEMNELPKTLQAYCTDHQGKEIRPIPVSESKFNSLLNRFLQGEDCIEGYDSKTLERARHIFGCRLIKEAV